MACLLLMVGLWTLHIFYYYSNLLFSHYKYFISLYIFISLHIFLSYFILYLIITRLITIFYNRNESNRWVEQFSNINPRKRGEIYKETLLNEYISSQYLFYGDVYPIQFPRWTLIILINLHWFDNSINFQIIHYFLLAKQL